MKPRDEHRQHRSGKTWGIAPSRHPEPADPRGAVTPAPTATSPPTPSSSIYSCCDLGQPAPAGQPPHGVVAVFTHELSYLLVLRGPDVPAPGWWCFPGGGVDPGETEEQALVREIEEELGVRIDPIERVWRATTAWGIDLAWWTAAGLTPGSELRLAPSEIAEARWFTRSEAQRLERLLGSNHAFFDRRP